MIQRLLGTAALLASSLLAIAPAQADDQGPGPFISVGGALDVRVSGYVETRFHIADRRISQFGVEDNGGADRATRQTVNFRNDQELVIRAEGLHDPTGIESGAQMELELGSGTNTQFDEAWIFIRNRIGDLRFGNEDDALDDMSFGGNTLGAASGGLDGDQFTAGIGRRITDSDEATKIRFVSQRFSGFQIGANYAPQTEAEGSTLVSSTEDGFRNYGGVAGQYLNTFGNVDVGAYAAYNTGNSNSGEGGTNLSGYAFSGLLGYDGFGDPFVSGYWGDEGEGNDEVWNIGIGAELGPVATTVFYGRQQVSGADDPWNVVLSSDVGLLPGVSLQNELAYVDLRNTERVGSTGSNPVRGWETMFVLEVKF